MKRKKQTKYKPARLPGKMKFAPEGRGISPDEPPESTFDPNFPGREYPTEQWLTDRDLIWKIKDLPTFLTEVKVIIEYWTFYDNPKLFGRYIYGPYEVFVHHAKLITWEIFQKGERLRQDYLKDHPELNIRPLTNDLYEMESWRFDAERALKPNLMPMPEILENFKLDERTLRRRVKQTTLKDYRPEDHAPNAPMILDFDAVLKLYPNRYNPTETPKKPSKKIPPTRT